MKKCELKIQDMMYRALQNSVSSHHHALQNRLDRDAPILSDVR